MKIQNNAVLIKGLVWVSSKKGIKSQSSNNKRCLALAPATLCAVACDVQIK